MNHLIILLVLFASSFTAAAAEAPRQPLRSGVYVFEQKFAEHPDMPSSSVTVKIRDSHIVVNNDTQSGVFPKAIIAEGELMWHAKSRKWIIGHNNKDRYADEVGGCTDGPEVVDLKNRIYWTC